MKGTLTRQQIYGLADALRALEAWEHARDFGGRVYGYRAHTVTVHRLFFDAEPTRVTSPLRPSIESWSVLDVQGQPIEADLTLDFWHPHLPTIQRALGRGNARSAVQSIIQNELNAALPAEVETYILDRSPPLPLLQLSLQDEEPEDQPSFSQQEEGDENTGYSVTRITRGDLKTCGFTRQEIASLTDPDMVQVARTMAEGYLRGSFWTDLRRNTRSILDGRVPLG